MGQSPLKCWLDTMTNPFFPLKTIMQKTAILKELQCFLKICHFLNLRCKMKEKGSHGRVLCEGQMEGMATNNVMLGTSKQSRFPQSYLLSISDAATKAPLSLPSCSYWWEPHPGWQIFPVTFHKGTHLSTSFSKNN